MRFHWMNRGEKSSVKDIQNISNEINSYKYYSMLLTYHSKNKDMLVKSVASLNNQLNIKHMLAIRTYAISPEYMAMICESYEEMFPGKLILNIVSGDIHPEESSIDDIVWISDQLDTPQKRLKYTNDWLKKFYKISKVIPEIVMGGHSNETRTMCNDFNATHLSMLNMYNDYMENNNKVINTKQMIACAIVIRPTKKEAEDFLNDVPGSKQWTLFGTKESVKQDILNLNKAGVTDLMLSKIKNDDEFLIHELVKEIVDERN